MDDLNCRAVLLEHAMFELFGGVVVECRVEGRRVHLIEESFELF